MKIKVIAPPNGNIFTVGAKRFPLRRSVADRGVRRPSRMVEVKTSVVQGTAPLGECKPVPICFVATLVSLAIAPRGPLPIASAKKHHTLLAAASLPCAC